MGGQENPAKALPLYEGAGDPRAGAARPSNTATSLNNWQLYKAMGGQ